MRLWGVRAMEGEDRVGRVILPANLLTWGGQPGRTGLLIRLFLEEAGAEP